MYVRFYSQSLLLCDVKRGCHVDEGRKAVQVVTVGMRKDGVGLNRREEGGRKCKDWYIKYCNSAVIAAYRNIHTFLAWWQTQHMNNKARDFFSVLGVSGQKKYFQLYKSMLSFRDTAFIFKLPCVEVLPRGWWLWWQADHHCWSPLRQYPAVTDRRGERERQKDVA